MRNFYITLSAYIFFILIIFFAIPRSSTTKISADAVWNPPSSAYVEISKDCSLRLPSLQYTECVLHIMERYGASREAVAFTRSLNGHGFLSGFRNTGKVDVAYANVMAADHSDAFYLVNGKPSPIDVDNPSLLREVNLDTNPVYIQIKKQYPNTFLMPGNHDWPKVNQLPDRGQQFTFTYNLKDGCAACATVGTATIAFTFNQAGRFIGPELITVSLPSSEAPAVKADEIMQTQ